jgi:4-hydroxy-2-oxoheptanedioate aldolase
MSELPRLNNVIAALEQGKPAFTAFSAADISAAVTNSTSDYDGIVYEMEHNPWDINALKIAMQFMLSRKQIASSGSIVPNVTPIVRVPVNGAEKGQWHAKQALDVGVYGVVWPHISSVEEAYNAVAACRYPRLKSAPLYEPVGIRGDGPTQAVRYWGVTQQEYYQKADVWPLAPQGEILVILMIEDVAGMENLDDMLANVPGIGACLIGEGDLSQELGYPRQYEHPEVLGAMKKIVETCKKHNVAVGHPHVGMGNVERVLEEGYTFLMAAPVRTTEALKKGLELSGRSKSAGGAAPKRGPEPSY